MEIIDFEAVCRICWGKNELKSMFNEDIPSYCEMLMMCTPVEVCEENGLPTKLCENCCQELEFVFAFRTKCIESDEKLRQYYQRHGIQTTVSYVHDPIKEETIETIQTTVGFPTSLPTVIPEGFVVVPLNEDSSEPLDTEIGEDCEYLVEERLDEENEDEQEEIEDKWCPNVENYDEESIQDKIEKSENTEKIYQCILCDKKYQHSRNLKRHVQQEHSGKIKEPQYGPRVMRCSICRQLFSFRNALVRHLRVVHQDITKHIRSSRDLSAFIERTDQPSDDVKGILGDLEAKEEILTDDDTQTDNSVDNTIEEVVSAAMENQSKDGSSGDTVQDSEEKGQPLYKCNECGRAYRAKNNLRRHTKDKHSTEEQFNQSDHSKQYVCSLCGRGFARRGLLMRHEETHLKPPITFQCEQCGQVFSKASQLKQHNVRHEPAKRHQCEVCAKLFLRAATLRVHAKSHDAQKPWQCSKCDRGFVVRAALQAHERTHSHARPFVCEVCSRTFRHPAHLDTHRKLHTGERPFACTMCSKRFTTSTHLKYHIKAHLGQREHGCTICGRAFIHKSELEYHIVTHTKQKECPCPICGKLFGRTNQVTKHMKQVHKVRKNYYATVPEYVCNNEEPKIEMNENTNSSM